MRFGVIDHPMTGVAVPVSALRSRLSCGVGEYPDLATLGAANVLEADVQGVQGEGAQGAVGRAVGSRVVHGQELDHLEAGAGRPGAERREVGVLADAAALAAPQGRHRHGDARHRVIDRAELHELTVARRRTRRNRGSRGRGRKVKMTMNAARCRILPPFRGRLHDSVADAVARCQFAGMVNGTVRR